jgi:hypothetical protein
MQHCEKSNHDARLVPSISELARVDFYRCPVCGEALRKREPIRHARATRSSPQTRHSLTVPSAIVPGKIDIDTIYGK